MVKLRKLNALWEVKTIKKFSSEYKEWKKRNDAKKARNKRKHKIKRRYSNSRVVETNNNIKTENPPVKSFQVPEIFSIVENPEQTISFLNGIIESIGDIRNKLKHDKSSELQYLFQINLKNVKRITGDALMYLLAVIKNTKGQKCLPINWSTNFPEDNETNEFLRFSGYIDFMKSDKNNLKRTNENVQIRTGMTYVYSNDNIDVRKEVIDFTAQKLNKNKKELQFLFNILTEIITNIEHAYNKRNELIFDPSWYIMVENDNNKIKYTFMDHGFGIPTTVKKKTVEEVLKMLNLDKEYKYIKTALDGSYKRTQTGKDERSTGLPDVYEKYINKKISNLIIISNYAYYCEDKSKDLTIDLTGTIICWEIEKEMIV